MASLTSVYPVAFCMTKSISFRLLVMSTAVHRSNGFLQVHEVDAEGLVGVADVDHDLAVVSDIEKFGTAFLTSIFQ